MEMEMEAGDPSSKKRRPVSPGEDEDGGGADILSVLPDALLGEIITLLPTKDGARTQILAPRWRHLWLAAPLNLDCNELALSDDLAGIVSKILSSHLAPARRFCVCTYGLGERTGATVDSWLRSPALDNVQELDLCYIRDHPLSASTFRFSATLRVVTIYGCNLSDSTVQALNFPLLEQLGIENVSISELSLHNMIASCPVLKCLFIKLATGFRCIRINSHTLKSIAIIFNGVSQDKIQLQELIIESAPCLEMLLDMFNCGLHATVVSAPKLKTLGYLSKQYRDLHDDVDLSTRLVFGSATIQGLRVDSLTAVVRTVKILAVRMHPLNLDMVIELMRCFPCLENLYIQCCSRGEKNLWRKKHKKLISRLDIHLKTIVISSYRGFMSEVNFATFFVLNAKNLELMIFEVKSTNEEFITKQQKKLQLDKRASIGAKFHFTTDSYLRSEDGLDINHVSDLDLPDPFKC